MRQDDGELDNPLTFNQTPAHRRPTAGLRRMSPDIAQTRRRFGGLHPLCGIGVTSRIAVMTKPTA